MKSIFFTKTLLWRITFTFIALLVVGGLIRLNSSFSSIELDNAVNSVYSAKSIENLNIEAIPDEAEKKQQNAKSQFFIEYRMQRDRARGQQIDLLREIVDNTHSSEEVRKEAQKRLLNISQLLEKEMEIENLIRAKDFKDAVVFLQDKTATVIVQAEKLTADEQDKIKGIVNRTTGIEEREVIVMPKP